MNYEPPQPASADDADARPEAASKPENAGDAVAAGDPKAAGEAGAEAADKSATAHKAAGDAVAEASGKPAVARKRVSKSSAARKPAAKPKPKHKPKASAKPRTARPRRKPLPAVPARVVDTDVALRRVLDERRASRLSRRLAQAADAYAADRYPDAREALAPVVKEAPLLPEGRELMGLVMYRLGRWADAVVHLEAFRELAGTAEQNPVLADCHRALKNYDDVEALWRELGEASPGPELMTEGRIVAAGALADRGEIDAAIALLEKGWSKPRRPRAHHLRRAYALADLCDRAGAPARARTLWSWIARHDPRFADVRKRLQANR